MKEIVGRFKGGSGETIRTRTFLNKNKRIVAKLYFVPNGNLHADSWLCHDGWGNK